MLRSRDDYTPPMSPKNSTGSKAASLKIEGENGGPEIFVLPPQLLKKLGINLSTILIPEEATSNNASGNDTTQMPNCSTNFDQLKQSRSITCAENEFDIGSTILQTANLMKKSLLLSPTFTPEVANMPGELEIACAVNYPEIHSNCKENVDSNAMSIKHNTTEADLMVSNSHQKLAKELQSTKNFGKKNYKNAVNGIDMVVDPSDQEMNIKIMELVGHLKAQNTENVAMDILEITDQATPTNTHLDENQLSNCSNNNPELPWIAHPENSTTQANIDLNKISIMSEQILCPSHFKEHNLNSNISNFLPIPINGLITTNKLTDDDDNQNIIACLHANSNEFQQNLESSKQTDSTLQNNLQNSETILMYDDKGIIINTENSNGNVDVDFPVHIVGNESLTLDDKYTVAEEILGKVENPGELNADCNFDVCIEFNVSDIEKHLEENEDILESFVNEITGNDAYAMMEKLENSEEACSKRPREVTIIKDMACIELESYPATNISQLKSYQNQSNNYDTVVDKVARPGDYCSSNNNVSKIYAVVKATDAPQHVKYGISKGSGNKFLINCNSNQNSKNKIESEQSCVLSVSVSNTETNKKFICGTNTVDNSKYVYNDQLKNNVENETRASEKGTKKETNLIGKGHNAKESINSTNNKLYSSNSGEDIAMLLHQITRQSESVKPLCQSIDNKWLHAKCQQTYKPRSKMHIQGVEKPGGSGSIDENIKLSEIGIKTYKKSIKPKKIPQLTSKKIVIQDKIHNDLCSTDESSKYDQERISVDFCLCEDFGSLTCYDDERLYEHIHFLDHKKVYCDSQFLFSIYNEEEIAKYEQIVDKEIEHESPQTCAFNICWNNLLNNEVTEIENIDNIDKACYERNNLRDFSTNTNLNAEVQQNVPEKTIIKSSKSSNHGSVEIDASVRNEISCESGSNIEVKIIQPEAKTISDQMKYLSKAIIKEDTVGTKAHDNLNPKNLETCQLSENVDISLANCGKSENGDNSLRPIKQSTPMELESNTTTSQVSNEIMAEVRKPEAVIRKEEAAENLQNETENQNKKGKKRRKSSTVIANEPGNSPNKDEPSVKKSVKCGVCEELLIEELWDQHCDTSHCSIAWKAGETIDLQDQNLVQKLQLRLKVDSLACPFCDFISRRVKKFLAHVTECMIRKNISGVETIQETKEVIHKRRRKAKIISVVCAVCSCSVEESEWIEHIAKEHNYLAWREGEEPLNIANEDVVRQHLNDILKDNGSLICHKCGYSRKNVKTYYNHAKKCAMQMTFNTSYKRLGSSKFEVSATSESENRDSTVDNSNSGNSEINNIVLEDTIEQCGVCKEKVKSDKWMDHIERKHEYLAWKEGQEPLNLQNEEEVYQHLYCIVKEICRLKCSKCGLERKYVKAYLQHYKTCSVKNEENTSSNESIVCGVCSEMTPANKWKFHAMDKHYNVAWRAGETPIDLNNPLLAEKLMKEYKEHHKMVCKICKISRVSCLGFYAHILTCGKSDEEIEQFKSTCEICYKQYLTIYHQQHMTAHSAQELVREQKRKTEQKMDDKNKELEEKLPSSGPRRAALKARSVIEKYKANIGAYSCLSCGYDAGNKTELGGHKCMKNDPFSDSEESAKVGSGEDSSESEIESNVSEDEQSLTRKKRYNKHIPTRTQRLPFSVKNPNTYVAENSRAYCNFHFTDDNLFPDLYNLRLEPVSEMELPKYMPPLEESCKVKFGSDWVTYKRFEAKHTSGYSLFTGASIQCISWVPSISDEAPGGQLLSIVCHNGSDMPRLEVDQILTGPGLIQIWSFQKFKSTPKFVFGLAHDLGTVWAIDWCPSGAQDVSSQAKELRLGLLAAASSNGSAYVFSVPNPCLAERDTFIYKMTPVLEMRLSTMSNKKYQATSIRWSPQKGHSVILVGYGDGTIAYYDLHNESPLLKTEDNNITVLYPYHDERPHNCCVTDVGAYPSMDPLASAGAVCTVSPTGCELSSRGSVWPSRVRARVPASGVSFTPLWPIVTLSGDDAVVNTGPSELQWSGGVKRVVCTLASASCVHCTRVALFTLPQLRVSFQHPAFEDPKRITVGSIQMVPLGKKRKQKVNDDLTVKLEPVTYEDVIAKYGLEFALDSSQTTGSHIFREMYPERFPLADIKSMAFCRSATYHSKLAVATHAGIVFIVTV